MRKRRWFPILYMFVVTGAFSSVLIGFTAATEDRVQANEMLAFERAVVTVLPGLFEPGLSSTEIHRRFVEEVRKPESSTGGAYTYRQAGQVVAYALPFEGDGFWAPIRGVIGIAADRRTVTSIWIYEQTETPGLGGEIVKPAFRGQFAGKELARGGDPLDVVRPGSALGANDVHAVTGATQTSVRLEAMLNQAIAKWRQDVGGEGGV